MNYRSEWGGTEKRTKKYSLSRQATITLLFRKVKRNIKKLREREMTVLFDWTAFKSSSQL